MADRYWVGGTANWDGTAGTKWAATSGGTGGASVPTSADDVFFDANSGTGTVTIATGNTGTKSINCTGFTGTFAGSANISVAGSVTLVAGMTVSYTGALIITNTGTIITAGKSLNTLNINGAGITVTLGDSLTLTSNLTIDAGTFSTNNFSVSAFSLTSNGSNSRTINLGSSTVSLSGSTGINFTLSTGLTFNAGTSQINLTGASIAITGGTGQTFYNVAYTNTSSGTRNILGVNTFNNLSVVGRASAGVIEITLTANQTINGTLSTTGTAGNRRVWFRSDTYGVRRTLTVNSAPSLTDADFRDIIVRGTAAPISGTRIGNRGACVGITFSAPKTVYLNSASNTAWESNVWAATSGGSVSTDNFPLPQDTAIIENASIPNNSVLSIPSTIPFISSIDMSARTNAITVAFNAVSTCYGSWKNGSGTAFSGTSALTFEGQGTKTITSAGKTFTCPITIDAYGGNVELADALNIGFQTLTVTNGTFDTKNFNVTAGDFNSGNSNVRTIKLGSSTITLSSNINAATTTNLTFNAGTSQINLISGAAILNATNLTFNNVSFTSTSTGTRTLIASSTFNNLLLTASATGLSQLAIGGNQTVTGTLTVAGSSATQRAFVRSGTIGTPITLTVNSLSANDCDFRDITIVGNAAGSSPTRAGNCGGNSGITFPAPKTVYYRFGVGNWGANTWSFTSGGSIDAAAFPLAQDTAVFPSSPTPYPSSGQTVTIAVTHNIGTVDMSARTTDTMTLTNSTNGITVYGNWINGSGTTISGTGTITFSGRGTQTITSAGKTFTQPITIDSATGTVQLGDAFNSSETLTLTNGTVDAVSYNLTCTRFVGNNGTVNMGSGTWTLSGTGAVWTTPSLVLKGTANILLSDTSTSARTFSGSGFSYNKLTIGGTTGTSTTTITGNNQFTELASTKTVAHTIDLGSTTQTFGKWSVTGSAGNVVTLTGTGTSHILAGSATSGIDYLAMGSIGFATSSPAEFYAGANSTGTAAAPVFRTATPAARTLYWVGGTGNWNDTARWSLSSGGSGGEPVPRSMDNVVFNSASNATAYTATVNAITGGNRCNSLTISAPASGNVTLAGSTALFIHGNVTLPATGLTRTYIGSITLSGSTTGKTFTTNGVALGSSTTVNGVGCEWTLGSATDFGVGSQLVITNGSFNTANYTVSCASFTSNNSNSRTINLGSSTVNISVNGALSFNPSVGLTFNAGTSQINLANSNAGINGGSGQAFYNVSFTNTGIGTATIQGSNTFNNLTIAGTTSSISTISINANQTINGTLTLSAGTNATRRTFVRSDTIGTTRTLTCNAVSATDVDFRDITIAGSAAPVSGTRLGDCKGNSGITFDAPKTVYWNAVAGNWSNNAWALTAGGTPNVNNFPLAQDTAVFTSTSPASGTTASINAAYNIGTIDMSARTSNTMTLATGSQTPTIYGNWINGTGTTLTGTNIMTFAGRGSQTITSAGIPFTQDIRIESPSGSVTLQDALTLPGDDSSVFTLASGTFNTANFNVTLQGVNSSRFNVLGGTLNLGSSLITLGKDFVVFGAFTLTGTGTLKFTNNSASTFSSVPSGIDYSGITIDQGGTGVLTLTGSNTFANITNTASGPTTIALSGTQRVAAFTATGTAGNVLTITGNTSNLIYTGSGNVSGLDYLNIQGRAYGPSGELDGIWYGGANSVNSGSLGWVFAAGVTPPPSANSNFFLMFA